MFAYVENGIVKELCRNESPFNVFFHDYASKFIQCPDTVEQGDTFDGTTWGKPDRTPTREDLKARRSAAVDAIEVTTQAGNTFDGDEVAQGRMVRAIVALNAQPQDPTPTVTWVLADNTAIPVTAAELTEALALAGAAQAAIWVI